MQVLNETLKIDTVRTAPQPNAPFGKNLADCLQYVLKTAEEMGFKTYNADDMLAAIDRALGAYANKPDLKLLRERCMTEDFTWGRSANTYIRMYKEMLK